MARRFVLRLTAAVVVAALAGALLVLGVRRQLDRRAAEHLDGIAQEFAAGASGTEWRGPTCSRLTFVRCLRTANDPETEARGVRAQLAVLAGRTPSLECGTLGRQRLRSCLVRLDEHGRALVVTVDPELARRDGELVPVGSRVQISTG